MRSLAAAAAACLGVVALWAAEPTAAARLGQVPAVIQRASRAAIVEAMRAEQRHGYNLLATANGARLSAGVALSLVRQARAAAADPAPILLDHRDFFDAFLEVTGLPADRAPTFVRMANDYREDQYIDARPGRVIARIVKGPTPLLAVTMVTGWPDGPGVPDGYTYADEASTPPLRVTHKRVTSYRLLDFGDRVLFDEIQGVYGRATGGVLGLMFAVIGDGQAVRSFIAVSSDGLQVTRTTARKLITVTQTATVTTEGKGDKGLPPRRADLVAIEQRLQEPFEAVYVPLNGIDPAHWRARLP